MPILLQACATKPIEKNPPSIDEFSLSCQKELGALNAIEVKEELPTYGFLKNQICIAQKACTLEQSFENPQWLDEVLKDFIDAYVNRTNDWKSIIDNCLKANSNSKLGALFCQKNMAQYHINIDLAAAIEKNGCGTDKDWSILETSIKECVDEAKYPIFIGPYVKNRIITYRNQVRAECKKTENKKGAE